MSDQFKSGRGGLRSPAGGRPKNEIPKRTRSWKLTDEEYTKINEYLKELRKDDQV